MRCYSSFQDFALDGLYGFLLVLLRFQPYFGDSINDELPFDDGDVGGPGIPKPKAASRRTLKP